MNKYFTISHIPVEDKQKSYSISLVVKETQIKLIRYSTLPQKLTKKMGGKSDNIKIDKDVEKTELTQ